VSGGRVSGAKFGRAAEGRRPTVVEVRARLGGGGQRALLEGSLAASQAEVERGRAVLEKNQALSEDLRRALAERDR
jgi:hypothetical protein